MSRRVRHYPVQPRVDLRADERGRNWILAVRASDRTGLLYAIARVLAARGISVQLAKILTLGERVEDTFVLHGPALADTRTQTEVEQELLGAMTA